MSDDYLACLDRACQRLREAEEELTKASDAATVHQVPMVENRRRSVAEIREWFEATLRASEGRE